MPFFSIVIPTLNEEKYLPHLLQDLSGQTFTDFEVIIVDAHSKDKTRQKAQAYATSLPAFSFVTSPKKGVCAQRNYGAQKAKHPWLIFMDADNRLPPYLLQGIKYHLEKQKVDVFALHLEPDTKNIRDQNVARFINLYVDMAKHTKNPSAMESLLGISRAAFRQIGGFDESIVYAEGVRLLKDAQKKGLTYEVFKDPVYTYSFRRFRTQGNLKMAQNASLTALTQILNLSLPKNLQQQLYPMKGGAFFDQKHQPKTTLEAMFKRIFTQDLFKS